MSSPASSPSTTPSRPSPYLLQAQCVSELGEITNQLLEKDATIRFQCLASHRDGRSLIQRRCGESCETQARPKVFEQAKKILQRNSPVTIADYVGIIIRILFCKKHGEANTFKKYGNLLERHWKGDGAPEELKLLEAIRQAYQLPSVESIQAPNFVESTLSLPGNPSSPQLESRSISPGEQQEVKISLAPTCSTPFGIPSKASFEFSSSAHNIQFPLRLARDEMPRLHSTQTAPSTSTQEPDILLPTTPASSEEVSNSTPETVSTNPQSDNPNLKAFNSNKFLPDYWGSHDFFSSVVPSGGRISRSPVWNIAKSSKYDLFLEHLSNSAADTAPPLFETTSQQKIPAPTLNNRSSNNPDSDLPAVIDIGILQKIKKPATKEGYVYILKAPEFFRETYPGDQPRVKIGISVDVDGRIAQLKKHCGIFDLERIADRDTFPHRLYYKVEELVHSELANFRRVFQCKKCDTEHQEWFAVSEEVALQTVQRWRRFIFQEPYDQNGILTDHWSKMLTLASLNRPGREEEYDDHEKRNDRWNRWLDEGIISSSRLK